MSDQSRRARAEWTLFEAAGRDLTARAEALGLGREDLGAQVEPLQLSVEGGCVEYKRRLVNEGFRAIEEARYRSLTSAQILGVAKQFAVYVFVASLQRLMADGTVVLRDTPRPDGAAERIVPEPETDVKAIMAEIQERVSADPQVRTNQSVKNVLMQLSRYSRELERFKELTGRTPADKRVGIASNFRKTTEEIFASIRRNYEQLVQDERDAQPVEPQNILLRVPISKLAGLFLKQARTALEVRSGLLFAREQYGTRELLLDLADRHRPMIAMIDEERNRYLELGGTESLAIQMSRAFARELRRRIERESEVY